MPAPTDAPPRGARLLDSWRFAVGTLTALPVQAPRSTGREVSGPAMLLAPLAVLPLAALVGLMCWSGRELGLAPVGTAAAAIALLALGSRAFHLDGLADTTDGLTASYDRTRSLEIMRTGDTGPAGAAAVVLVLGIQIGALTSVLMAPYGPLLAATLVCVSRGALLLTCQRGVPGARPDGLGATPAGTLSPLAGVLGGAVLTAVTAVALVLADESWWRAPICLAVAALVVALLVRRCVRRLGGVTGDVYGAAIEISLAVLLLGAS